MSYVDIPKVEPGTPSAEAKILSFLDDIKSRKEFYELSYDDTEEHTFMKRFLQMHGPQIFVKNFVNLNTPYKRLFINWQTGTGKTIAALGIAKEFASRAALEKKKKIFIVGFTKSLFVGELLNHPSFGFITSEELDLLHKYKEYDMGTIEYKRYTDMMTQLKRRITDKGYQKFYGYKELATKLFMRTDKAIIERFDWKDLFATSIIKKDLFVDNLNKEIKNGNIKINTTLLDNMKNSLLIADEIHNLYNVQTENNYGVALQYILDSLGQNAPYTVLMSATPMTGSASEIIDLLNLLVEPRFLPDRRHLRKEDFFEFSSEGVSLKPGALDKIGHLAAGRVTFLIDVSEGKYPKRMLRGEPVENIPYLRFTQCLMSDFQKKTISAVEGSPQSFLYDFAFPMADRDYGVVNVTEYRKVYKSGDEFLEREGIKIIDNGSDFYVSGRILESDHLGRYSQKYKQTLDLVMSIMKDDVGKIMVFHPMVHSTGVLLIQEIFAQNGFIDESSSPIDSTICSICCVAKKDHAKSGELPHDYMPARYITLHSGLDQNTMVSLIDKFNMMNNLYGHRYRVIIGARVIREGYNFKAVRHQIITSMPDNIPTLIQIHGRCIRRNSHIDLPEHLRDVNIWTLYSDDNTHSELFKYTRKSKDYAEIQKVERVLRIYSTDGFLSYPKLKSILPHVDSQADLNFLPFTHVDVSVGRPDPPKQKATYYAYGYGQREIETVVHIIWVLFSIYPVWTYDDLLEGLTSKTLHGESLKIPTFGFNTSTLERDTFDLALYYISNQRNTFGSSIVYMIFRCGSYFILTQVSPTDDPIVSPEIYIRDRLSKHVKTRITIPIGSVEDRISDKDIINDINTLEYPELVLLKYSSKTQIELLKKAISSQDKVYKNAIDLYSRFKIVFTYGTLAKNKKAMDLYAGDHRDPKDVIGILYKNSAMIYISSKKEFQELPIKLFIKPRAENKAYVGFTDNLKGNIVFKIREPMKKTTDLRKMERGAVCETRLRDKLMLVIRKLTPFLLKSPAWKAKVVDLSKMKTVNLCHTIRLMLLSLEEDARKSNSDELYLYLLEDSN